MLLFCQLSTSLRTLPFGYCANLLSLFVCVGIMYVCIYICVCACLCVCMYNACVMYVYVLTDVHTQARTYIYTCMDVM